jgi:hypothetical protein
LLPRIVMNLKVPPNYPRNKNSTNLIGRLWRNSAVCSPALASRKFWYLWNGRPWFLVLVCLYLVSGLPSGIFLLARLCRHICLCIRSADRSVLTRLYNLADQVVTIQLIYLYCDDWHGHWSSECISQKNTRYVTYPSSYGPFLISSTTMLRRFYSARECPDTWFMSLEFKRISTGPRTENKIATGNGKNYLTRKFITCTTVSFG